MRFIPAHGRLPHLGNVRKVGIAFRLPVFVLLMSFERVRRVSIFQCSHSTWKLVSTSVLVVVGSHDDDAVGSYTKLDRESKPFVDPNF